jgi:hypothetical protein
MKGEESTYDYDGTEDEFHRISDMLNCEKQWRGYAVIPWNNL